MLINLQSLIFRTCDVQKQRTRLRFTSVLHPMFIRRTLEKITIKAFFRVNMHFLLIEQVMYQASSQLVHKVKDQNQAKTLEV